MSEHGSAQTIGVLHDIVTAKANPGTLSAHIADDAVFLSPVMHTPQEGRDKVEQYLGAALQLFGQHGFRYVREIVGVDNAALEFVAEIEGIAINGVDLIHFDTDGKIHEFKVMLRPLKAIQIVREKMLAQLAGG
ncbi:nuclear transport factor 2 family protein [Erythrobacter alti]|uniref:nuclear transport factor 2 family protein n=1 Tax=Erythrobacter alti TaxID=1896145 RepID=UPI0030F40241